MRIIAVLPRCRLSDYPPRERPPGIARRTPGPTTPLLLLPKSRCLSDPAGADAPSGILHSAFTTVITVNHEVAVRDRGTARFPRHAHPTRNYP